MAKSFEEKLNSELEKERPETLKDENLELFREFIDTVDMIDLENSQIPLSDDSPFIIEPIVVEVTVKSGVIGEEYETSKKAMRLKIILSPKFSFTNVPELVRGIQEAHNNSQEVKDIYDGNVYFTDITHTIARSYLFWAKQLHDFRDQIPEIARSHYDQYTKQLVEVAKTYQPDLAEDLDVPADLNLATINIGQLRYLSIWTKTVEGKEALERWQVFRDRVVEKYRDNPENTEHLMELIDSLVVIPNIKKSFATDIEQTIMARGEKEMWYLSDIPEQFSYELSREGAEKTFSKYFPNKWRGIDGLKQGLLDAKYEGNPEKIEGLQIAIFQEICRIVYSDKYWRYKSGNYKLSQVPTKEVNCMAQGAIVHTVMKEMIGEETLGGGRNNHFFPVLKTVTGKLVVPFNLSDFRVIEFPENSKLVELKDQEIIKVNNGCSWFVLGEHDNRYRAAVWNWIGLRYSSRFAGEKAISSDPTDPIYHANLAFLLSKKPGNGKRAEAMYLKAIELAPHDPEVNYYCFKFYDSEKNYEKAIIYCRETLRLLKTKPETVINVNTGTGNPYDRERIIKLLIFKILQLEKQIEEQRQARVGGDVDPHDIF